MIPSNEELQVLSLAALTALYNANNPPKPVKVFRTKAIALDRVKALRDGTKAAKQPRTKKAAKAPKAKKTRAKSTTPGLGRIRKPFDLPASKEIQEPRKETKRADVAAMLSRENGATVEQVMEKQEWTRREALEGIRLLHKLLGFGLRETDGRIRLVR